MKTQYDNAGRLARNARPFAGEIARCAGAAAGAMPARAFDPVAYAAALEILG